MLLALLAIALLGAWLWHWVASDPGYVLIALYGYSVETTLVVAVTALLLTWIVVWLVLATLRFPLRFWHRRQRHTARECLAGGLVALHEGRWRRAEKLLKRAAREPQHRLAALLGAARAAQQRGDPASADELLAQAAENHDPVSVALLAARQYQYQGDSAAIAALFDPEPIAALPPRALDIYLSALTDTGRAQEAVALLASLRASRVLEGAALEEREAGIIAAAMHQAPDAGTLASVWSELSRRQKTHARIVAAYARKTLALGDADAGVAAVEKALRHHWSPELVAVYGLLPRGERRSPLKMAEAWLADHPDDPELLVTLGRLCRNEQIWGKAEDYLQRALSAGAGAHAWEELGHMHTAQHNDSLARDAYAKALALSHTEIAQTPAARSPRERIAIEATPETRSSMGVPLLEYDDVDRPPRD